MGGVGRAGRGVAAGAGTTAGAWAIAELAPPTNIIMPAMLRSLSMEGSFCPGGVHLNRERILA